MWDGRRPGSAGQGVSRVIPARRRAVSLCSELLTDLGGGHLSALGALLCAGPQVKPCSCVSTFNLSLSLPLRQGATRPHPSSSRRVPRGLSVSPVLTLAWGSRGSYPSDLRPPGWLRLASGCSALPSRPTPFSLLGSVPVLQSTQRASYLVLSARHSPPASWAGRPHLRVLTSPQSGDKHLQGHVLNSSTS